MAQKISQKKKSHKKLWIILSIVAILVIAVIAWGVHTVKNMADAMTEAMSSNTAEVKKGSIEVITEGNGTVEPAGTETETVDYNVTLRRLYKQNGEAVLAGEVIAEFDGTALDESISALQTQLDSVDSQLRMTDRDGKTTVSSPVSGRVKRVFAGEGSSVLEVQDQNPGLMEISADGRLKVVFESEAQAAPGQKAAVVYGEEQIPAQIEEVKGNSITVSFEDSNQYAVDADVTVLNGEGQQMGTGKVQSSQPVYVTAASGTVKSISVEENEKVSAGNTLMKLEDTGYSAAYLALLEQREQLAEKVSKAGEYRKGYVVTASKDCIISELTAKEGEVLPAGTSLCKLMDTSSYQVILGIDELDIQDIEKGQKVDVTVDAAGDTVMEGTVSNVSMDGSSENGVAQYSVSVALKDAKGLLPGMSANGKITVDHNTEALLVPVDAIQTIDGKKKVTVVKKDGSTQQREVTLGLVNNENAQILDGVSEGEKVQIIVKLEDIYSQMGITMEESDTNGADDSE